MKEIYACFVLALLAGLAASTAQAADASAWSDGGNSAARLIAGTNAAGAQPLRAGIEIKLAPGWHTYWRYPGDSGVPPRFDFSGSENLAHAKVLYPAPHLLRDEAGQSLVYEDDVVFPLVVTPKQSGKPVRLRLKLDYAICEKLCVPAEASAELALDAGASAFDQALKGAEARVPKPTPASDVDLTVRRVNDAPKPLIAVDFKTSADKPVQLFVEGPTSEWALPIPAPAQGAPAGRRQFGFELDGLPPGVSSKGSFDLTFTIVEGDRALEVKSHLD
jgi:DsbC/DsbD-like thiol-disulfide interchange protein